MEAVEVHTIVVVEPGGLDVSAGGDATPTSDNPLLGEWIRITFALMSSTSGRLSNFIVQSRLLND